ncbi:Uncharacterised protein [Mycobacteroides abscessus subsp. abscessus]|uniref:hypothetical protein n=1 Tax=Dermabacter sp. HMSC06F07 TaxID=1581125 RepID=UPI000353FDE1|nr:hypothetical protein [Dermabacter sp. HMSC06F07]EPH14259.1 hypothetical protein HMPREF1484_01556 [Dermabacter sp. HFH0086]SHV76988.1 Uncharacterised protein [Mycobacteroides abscessus subsp. abscessus]
MIFRSAWFMVIFVVVVMIVAILLLGFLIFTVLQQFVARNKKADNESDQHEP